MAFKRTSNIAGAAGALVVFHFLLIPSTLAAPVDSGTLARGVAAGDLKVRVIGTASFQGAYTALIQDLNTLSDSFYRVGDPVYGYEITQITDKGIEVARQGKTYTIALETSTTSPDPAAAEPSPTVKTPAPGAPHGYLMADGSAAVSPNLYISGHDTPSGHKGALASAVQANTYLEGPGGTQWDLWTPEKKAAAASSSAIKAAATVATSIVTGRFVTPVATFKRLSSGFGYRKHPVTGGRKLHKGLDFSAKTGTRILAADNGKVIWSGWKGGFGYCVQIDHHNGYTTTYGHCSKLIADVGDNVRRGEYVAEVGSTGQSTGPHLHFEIRKNGKPIDPMQFFKGKI